MLENTSEQPFKLRSRIARADGGATAIEFALVAPLFFLFLFAIFEIALIVLFSSLLNDGARSAANYLREQTMQCVRQGTGNCTQATIAGMRAAACNEVSMGGMSCSADRLKLSVHNADDLVAKPVSVSTLIDEQAIGLNTARAYIIAIGYEWPFSLPTSRLLLPSSGDRVQLQARVYATTAERALR